MKKQISFLRKRQTWRVVLLLALAATAVFIVTRSMQSKTESNGESQWVTDLLRQLFRDETLSHAFVRKLAHFSEFFLLGAELSGLLWLDNRFSPQWYINIWFAGLLWALCDETVQIFSNRGPSVADVWLDAAGATCGILVLLGIRLLCKKISGRKQIPHAK